MGWSLQAQRLGCGIVWRIRPPTNLATRNTPFTPCPQRKRVCARLRHAMRGHDELQSSDCRLLQLELNDVDRCRADVLHRPRGAGVLPEELAGAQSPAAFGLARHAFADFATVDDDAHAGRTLGDGGSGLSRL